MFNLFRTPTQSAIVTLAILGLGAGSFIFLYSLDHQQQTNTEIQTNTNILFNSNSVSQNINETTNTNSSSQPPAEAISACIGKTINTTCEFSDKGVIAQGVCDDKPGVLACKKNEPPSTNQNTNQPRSTNNNSSTINSNTSFAPYSTCLEHTRDLAASKDCCDCMDADVSVRKACRDAAATYDFRKNTLFQEFTIPSTLGPTGDYSVCTSNGTQDQCKQCCDTSTQFACGDFQYCRTACDAL